MHEQTTDTFLGINKDYATLIFLPIITFFLALIFNWIRTKIKLKNSLKAKERYLYTWINLIEPQIIGQANSLTKFSKEIIDDSFSQLTLYDLHLDKLKIISPVDIVELFVTNKKGNHSENNQHLFEWENNITILVKFVDKIQHAFESFNKRYELIHDEWNKQLPILTNRYLAFVQSQISHDGKCDEPIVVSIINKYADWGRARSFKPEYMFNLFLAPVDKHLIEFTKKHPKNELIIQLIESVRNQAKIFNDRKYIIENHAQRFDSLSSGLKITYERLKKEKEYFQSRKLKFFIQLK